jgi:hypothetical protein
MFSNEKNKGCELVKRNTKFLYQQIFVISRKVLTFLVLKRQVKQMGERLLCDLSL